MLAGLLQARDERRQVFRREGEAILIGQNVIEDSPDRTRHDRNSSNHSLFHRIRACVGPRGKQQHRSARELAGNLARVQASSQFNPCGRNLVGESTQQWFEGWFYLANYNQFKTNAVAKEL